jgi:nucleotide-binding universal stress UspA family protein
LRDAEPEHRRGDRASSGVWDLLTPAAAATTTEAAGTCAAEAAASTAAERLSLSELGPIAETILGVLREVNADQIVMGTHGSGPLRVSFSARLLQGWFILLQSK